MNSSPTLCFDSNQMTTGTKHSKQLMSPKQKVKSRAPTPLCTVWKLLLPECVTGKKSNNKKHHRPKMEDQKNGKTIRKVLTLEDQFSISPTFTPAPMIGGQLYVLKQSPKLSPKTKRVHPSPIPTNDDANKHDDQEAKSATKARGSFSLETLVLLDRKSEDYWSSYSVSRRTSTGGRSKKKVSFKPPEENDVYLFYSPEE